MSAKKVTRLTDLQPIKFSNKDVISMLKTTEEQRLSFDWAAVDKLLAETQDLIEKRKVMRAQSDKNAEIHQKVLILRRQRESLLYELTQRDPVYMVKIQLKKVLEAQTKEDKPVPAGHTIHSKLAETRRLLKNYEALACSTIDGKIEIMLKEVNPEADKYIAQEANLEANERGGK